jgi:hypothetical protein
MEFACRAVGRVQVAGWIEDAIRRHLSAGNGILKVAALVGVESETVQRVKREMAVIVCHSHPAFVTQAYFVDAGLAAPHLGSRVATRIDPT